MRTSVANDDHLVATRLRDLIAHTEFNPVFHLDVSELLPRDVRGQPGRRIGLCLVLLLVM